MNIDLLVQLLRMPSPSRETEEVSNFVQGYLKELGVEFYLDNYGNIYNLSHKNKPVLSAHMDTVQGKNDVILSPYIKRYGNIIKGYGVIGGDDKCGVFIILELLKYKKDDINFILTLDEEIGGLGITSFVETEDFKGIPYGLVLDRRGNKDIICYFNDYGTKEFENELAEIGKKFGYSPAHGVFSDADVISNYISCANLSVGYYDAHSTSEHIVISDVENALEYVNDIIFKLDGKYFEAPVKYRGYYYTGRKDYSNVWGTCELCGAYTAVYKLSAGLTLCRDCMATLRDEIDEILLDADFASAEYFM